MQGQFNFGGGSVKLQNLPSLTQNGAIDISGPEFLFRSTVMSEAQMTGDWACNTCVSFADNAIPVTVITTNLQTSIQAKWPSVEGMFLEAGSHGDMRPVAMLHGAQYTQAVPILPLPGQIYPVPIWLGQDGVATVVVPSLVAGDVWSVYLGEITDVGSLTWAPEPGIKL